MKKYRFLFVVIAVFFTAQIVKADGPKGNGFLKSTIKGTLDPAEFQTAFKTLFTKGSTRAQIAEYFKVIDGFSFDDMKSIYRQHIEKIFGLTDVTDEEMLDIVEKTKFREPEKDHWETNESMYIPLGAKPKYDAMEWWNPKTVRENEYIGSVALNGTRKDWITTYCANPDKEARKKVVTPKVEKPATEVVILPGTNKYFYKTDTIRERNDTYKEVQNNFFLKTDNNTFAKSSNQSFTVNMEPEAKEVSSKSCDCPSLKREVTYAKERSCGCDEDHICQDHYKRLPKKVRKPLGQRTWFRIGTHVVAFFAGWFGHEWFDDNDNVVTGRVFTQGPFTPVVTNGPGIITQGPLFQ